MQIQPYNSRYLDAVVRLSLRAWSPVFDSIRKVISPELYQQFYPHDWQVSQKKAVEATCKATDMNVWIAIDSDLIVGFVAVKTHLASNTGEMYMIAVDPDYQRQGIATALLRVALDWMKAAGLSIAMIETGGDAGHAPARFTYEKLGFEPLQIVRYYKKM